MTDSDQHAAVSRRLRCEECGLSDDGRRGWTMHLDGGDELELVTFCPECDEREFGER